MTGCEDISRLLEGPCVVSYGGVVGGIGGDVWEARDTEYGAGSEVEGAGLGGICDRGGKGG